MIRLESKEDYENVQILTRQAFWNQYQHGADQHFLLHNLRKSKDFIPDLSLVVEEDQQIIAHIAYSHSQILQTITFGPVSVLPSKQGKGVGSQLIKYSIQKAKQLGFKAIIIMGHPSYYSRFGFKCTKQVNICLKDHIFYKGTMFIELQEGYLAKAADQIGIFEESQQFHINQQELNQYEKKFPPKEKFDTLSQKIFQIVSQMQWNQELPSNIHELNNRERLL